MWKFCSMLLVAGLVSVAAIEGARACGGGGGCGAMGGGRAYAGRASASRKVLAGGPTVQARQQVVRQQPAPVANRVAVKATSDKTPAIHTVANKLNASAKAVASPPLYTCPMHPQVQWTKPTDCPLCGMQLKLKRTQANAATRGSSVSPDHAAMQMDETTSESEAMNDMPRMGDAQMGGMDDMMMCPGCMMNMDGQFGMGRGEQAPAASQKASGGAMRGMAGMGCGC